MTVPLRFCDTAQVPAASCVSWSSPAKAFALRRVMLRLTRWRPRQIQARPLPPLAAGIAAIGIWRLLAVAAPHLAALVDHAADRNRFRLAHRLPAVLGHPELLLHRAVAASGAVGRAVADAGRGAGAAVAAQARRRADDRELRRPDGDRSRHRGVPVHDLSQSALVGDRGRPCHHSPDVCAVVARSVPHPPPAGAGLQAGLPCRAGRLFRRLAGRSLARLLRRRLSVEIRPLRRHRGVRLRQLRLHGIGRRRRRAPQGAAGGFLPSRRPAAEHHHDP